MSALTDAIAQLESGGSTFQGQVGSYLNYRYQQFSGFVNQYGFGETGINNYAQQVLAANPNATFGDLYGGYVTGTGNPATANINNLLTTTQPGAQGAYQNLMNNSPIPANTPLAQLLGQDTNVSPNANTSVFDAGAPAVSNADIGGLGTTNPSAYPFTASSLNDQPYNYNLTSGPFGAGTPIDAGNELAQYQTGQPGDLFSSVTNNDPAATIAASDPTAAAVGQDVAGTAPSAAGLDSALTGGSGNSVPGSDLFSGIAGGISGLFSGNSSSSGGSDFFAWLGDWAIRGAVILLGFIFIFAGLMLLRGNTILQAAPELAKVAAKV